MLHGRASKITHFARALASRSEELSLIPGPQEVEGENGLLYIVFKSPHTCSGTHSHTHISIFFFFLIDMSERRFTSLKY